MINSTVPGLPAPRNQRIYNVTENIIIFSLFMYAAFAPHSIALTQGSYLLGLVAWGVQLAATRNFKQSRSPIDVALFGFFACAVVSSFFSYVPYVSIKGLRSPAFFLAFYFVSTKVRSLRLATLLGLTLIGSCLINVGYSARQIAIGRGVRIDSVSADSSFARGGLRVGDVILQADDQKIKTLDDISRVVDSQRGRLKIKFQRSETIGDLFISRQLIKKAEGAGVERLGLTGSPGRSFRISGFYSHYETYAEVLQLIAAFAIGLLIATPNKRSGQALFLGFAGVAISTALILTSTRATMAGLAIAAAVMAVASFNRRTIAVAGLAILILAPVALVTLERSRGAAIFDPQEGSTAYRLEVWREAMGLIKTHPVVGIGKGSEGKLKETLGLYDEGRLPPGHFHSTPIQVATWWGLPALAFYIAVMTILGIETYAMGKRARAEKQFQIWGIALGGLGALVAFNFSSLVHFNFGDGEVVMTFWLLTGIVFAVRRISLQAPAGDRSEQTPEQPTASSSYKNRPQPQEASSESSVRVAGVRQS